MSRIELIGISGPALTGEQWPLLRRCAAIVVSRRYRPLVAGLSCPLIDIAPLAAMLDQVEEALAGGRCRHPRQRRPPVLRHRPHPDQPFRPGADHAFTRPCPPSSWPAPVSILPGTIWPWSASMAETAMISPAECSAIIVRCCSPTATTARTRWQPACLAALDACDDLERIAALRIRVAENLGSGR